MLGWTVALTLLAGGAAALPPTPGEPTLIAARQRIDIELQDEDLRQVFRVFADIGRVNIVVGPGVRGRVTCRFRNTPWDEVLGHIVRASGHALIREGNVYYVHTRDRPPTRMRKVGTPAQSW